jgi:hypothetical protein
MWLPALGAALFVAVGLWWAVTPPAAPPPAPETSVSGSAGAAAAVTALATAPAAVTHPPLQQPPAVTGQPAQPVRMPLAPAAASAGIQRQRNQAHP